MPGKVFLVGAGPGDPELLTLKAMRVLRAADVVLHDALISPEVLAFVPKTAEVRNVGKRCGKRSTPQSEINTLLVQYSLLGLQVVRLKGGDPLVFGRGGEEIEALRNANIDFEVVPGVTAALGASAAAQIPLTHRDLASAVMILTSHSKDASSDHLHWPRQIPPDTTLVIYMPGHDYGSTACELMAAGVKDATPCALISRATTREQKVFVTSVQDLPSAPQLPAPTLLIVGEVARFAVQGLQDKEVVSALASLQVSASHQENQEMTE